MRLFILFLSMFIIATSYGQFDQVKLFFQNEYLNCRIMDVSPNSISYILKDSSKLTTKQLSEVEKIKLYHKTNVQESFTTHDLFQALIEKESKKFVWMGLDFTYTKICHSGAVHKYLDGFFSSINSFVVKPKGEFKSLWKPNPRYSLCGLTRIDLGPVNLANTRIKMDTVFDCFSHQIIPLDSIRVAINNYTITDSLSGIGIVFFYNEIIKKSEDYSVYLVFFDLKSRSVLLCLRNNLKGFGITMERHWTSQLLVVINKIRHTSFEYFIEFKRIFD